MIYWTPICTWPSRKMGSRKPRSLTYIFPVFPMPFFKFTKLSPVTSVWHIGTFTNMPKDSASFAALPWPLWAIWITFSTLIHLTSDSNNESWLLKSAQLLKDPGLRVSGICAMSPGPYLGLSLLISVTWLVKDVEKKERSSRFIAWTPGWWGQEICKLPEVGGIIVHNYSLVNTHTHPSESPWWRRPDQYLI